MARYIEIVLEKRSVRCVAQLLDDEAPQTCEAVWAALPQTAGVWHAKYASNEVYILVKPLGTEPGPENRTIAPTAGDVMYFFFPPGYKLPKEVDEIVAAGKGVVDLALFYDRNNLLLNPREGYTPGNVFATVIRNLDEMKKACNSVFREGVINERLSFRRLEGEGLREWGLA
jgi:Protein of unknown function (DUF3830)